MMAAQLFKRGDRVAFRVSPSCRSSWVHHGLTTGQGTVVAVYAPGEVPDIPGHLYHVHGHDGDGGVWQSAFTAGELQRVDR